MAKVLIPLPHRDFDPTETTVPWRVLRQRGHEIAFATPDSGLAHADLKGSVNHWNRAPHDVLWS